MTYDIYNPKAPMGYKLKCILFCILPLLIYYRSVFGLFSEITTPILLFMDIDAFIQGAKDGKGFKFNSRAFFLILYIIAITGIGIVVYNGNASTINSLIVVISVIIILERNEIWLKENAAMFIQVYFVVTWIVAVAFLIQFFLYHIFHITLVLRFPILKINEAYGDTTNFGTSIYSYAKGFSQFAGFFSEKAHLATYVLPAILLYANETVFHKRNYVLAAVLSFTVILTASGTGVLGVMLIWMLTFMFGESNLFSSQKVGIVFLAILGIIAHFILLKYSDAYARSIGTLFSDQGINNQKTSVRVFRGLSIYGELPLINKIFGIGLRMYSKYVAYTGFSYADDSSLLNVDYFSAFSQGLVYFGIIGVILLFTCALLFVNGNSTKRNLFLLYLALSFGLSILFETTFLQYFALIIALSADSTENVRSKESC